MIVLVKTKAIIFDLDGTAVDSPAKRLPSTRLKAAFKSIEDEYYLCAATGRVWSFAVHILKDLDLSDPSIVAGGTQIFNPQNGEILWQLAMEEADALAAIRVLEHYPDYTVLCNDYVEEDYSPGGLPASAVDTKKPIFFIEQAFVPEEVAPEIVAKLSQIEGITATLVVAHKVGFKDIHITNRNATKEHAIAELLRIIKVDKAKTIGIGDGHNDTHLFNAVNRKIAMGNGVSELKELADEVIGNVSEDGLAEYIEGLHRSKNT